MNPVLTDPLRHAMREITARKGPFTLFALFMRTDALGSWDLVASAPWLESGKLKAVGELTRLLSTYIGDDSLRQFARIATVRRDEAWVRFILKNLPVDDGELHVSSNDLSQLDIEMGVIFRAKVPPMSREEKDRIFKQCLQKYPGVNASGSVATVPILTDVFACMRLKLEESVASDEDRAAFVDAIVRAIQSDPGLTKYVRDKIELQKVLRSAFEGIPYEPTNPPMLAPKSNFLSRVGF